MRDDNQGNRNYGDRNRMGHREGHQHSRTQESQGSEYGRRGGEYESGEWHGSGYDDWQSNYEPSRSDRNLARRTEYGGYEGSGRPGGREGGRYRQQRGGEGRYAGHQGDFDDDYSRYRTQGGRDQGGFGAHDDFGGYAGRSSFAERGGYGGRGPQDDYEGYAGRGGYGSHQGFSDSRRDTGFGGGGGYGGGHRHSGRGGGYGTGAGQAGQTGGYERGSTFSSPGGRQSNWQGAWDQSSQGSQHQRGFGMDPSDYEGGSGFQDRYGGQEQYGSRRSMPKGYQRSDERLREDVCERLSHSGLDVSEVSVRVSSGHVTLEGTVDDRRTKHAIENCADDCMGVQDVDNRIRVQRQGSSSGHFGMGGSQDSFQGERHNQGRDHKETHRSDRHSGGSGSGGTATGGSGVGADPNRGGTGQAGSNPAGTARNTDDSAKQHGSTESGGTGTGIGKQS